MIDSEKPVIPEIQPTEGLQSPKVSASPIFSKNTFDDTNAVVTNTEIGLVAENAEIFLDTIGQ